MTIGQNETRKGHIMERDTERGAAESPVAGDGAGALAQVGETSSMPTALTPDETGAALSPAERRALREMLAAQRRGADTLAPAGGVQAAVPKNEVARLLKLQRLLFDVLGVRLKGTALELSDGTFYDDVMVVQAKVELERAERMYGVEPEPVEFMQAPPEDGPARASISRGFDDDDTDGRRGIFR